MKQVLDFISKSDSPQISVHKNPAKILNNLTLVHIIRTITFQKAEESEPGCTSNNRCLSCPEAKFAVLK